MAQTVAQRIRETRRQLRRSQRWLSIQLGHANPSTVANWERGRHRPVRNNVEAIARALGVSYDTLDPEDEAYDPALPRGSDNHTGKAVPGPADDSGADGRESLLEHLTLITREDLKPHLGDEDVQEVLRTYLGMPPKLRKEARETMHAIAGGLSPRSRSVKKVRG